MARSSMAVGWTQAAYISEAPHHTDDLADDLHAARIDDDRSHRGVLRLEHDALAVAQEALDGGLALARVTLEQCDDDVVGLGRVLSADQDQVAIADVRVDHALAAHAQRKEVLTAARQEARRQRHLALAVLGGEQRRPGGDTSEDRHLAEGRGRPLGERERARGAPPDLTPLQRALALERAQVIEGSAWRHPELLTDLTHRRRHAVARREGADEPQHVALPTRELSHRGLPLPAPGSHRRAYDTQRLLRSSTKKRGEGQAGSHGSHAGHSANP